MVQIVWGSTEQRHGDDKIHVDMPLIIDGVPTMSHAWQCATMQAELQQYRCIVTLRAALSSPSHVLAATFCAASAMIVFGAFIGKATPTQVSADGVSQWHCIAGRASAGCSDDNQRFAGFIEALGNRRRSCG